MKERGNFLKYVGKTLQDLIKKNRKIIYISNKN